MTTARRQILCIGRNSAVANLRCWILAQEGYSATRVTLGRAHATLTSRKFDLVVLSFSPNEEEKALLSSLVGETPTLALNAFEFPSKMLERVEAMLSLPRVGCPPTSL
jgi:hypothetical protein